MSKIKLDAIDRKILGTFMVNSKTPVTEIARDVDISGAAVHQRLRKLEKAKVIKAHRILVDPKILDLNVCAFVTLDISPSTKFASIVEQLRNIPEVTEVHFITGRHSIFAKVVCFNHDHLLDLVINSLQAIPGITDTQTAISLLQPIEHGIYLEKLNAKRSIYVKSEEDLSGKPPKVLKKRGRKPKNKTV